MWYFSLSIRKIDLNIYNANSLTGRQVVGQVKKAGKSRNFYQKVGKIAP